MATATIKVNFITDEADGTVPSSAWTSGGLPATGPHNSSTGVLSDASDATSVANVVGAGDVNQFHNRLTLLFDSPSIGNSDEITSLRVLTRGYAGNNQTGITECVIVQNGTPIGGVSDISNNEAFGDGVQTDITIGSTDNVLGQGLTGADLNTGTFGVRIQCGPVVSPFLTSSCRFVAMEMEVTYTPVADVTPPEISTAEILPAGNILRITFNENMTQSASPHVGWSFATTTGSVTINSGAWNSDTQLDLTLDRVIDNTEDTSTGAAGLSYSSASGNIQDTSANDLADVSDQAVTNNSSQNPTGPAPTALSASIDSTGTKLTINYDQEVVYNTGDATLELRPILGQSNARETFTIGFDDQGGYIYNTSSPVFNIETSKPVCAGDYSSITVNLPSGFVAAFDDGALSDSETVSATNNSTYELRPVGCISCVPMPRSTVVGDLTVEVSAFHPIDSPIVTITVSQSGNSMSSPPITTKTLSNHTDDRGRLIYTYSHTFSEADFANASPAAIVAGKIDITATVTTTNGYGSRTFDMAGDPATLTNNPVFWSPASTGWNPPAYYVSTTGNDTTGDGSEGNPFESINKAIRQHIDSSNNEEAIIWLMGTPGQKNFHDPSKNRAAALSGLTHKVNRRYIVKGIASLTGDDRPCLRRTLLSPPDPNDDRFWYWGINSWTHFSNVIVDISSPIISSLPEITKRHNVLAIPGHWTADSSVRFTFDWENDGNPSPTQDNQQSDWIDSTTRRYIHGSEFWRMNKGPTFTSVFRSPRVYQVTGDCFTNIKGDEIGNPLDYPGTRTHGTSGLISPEIIDRGKTDAAFTIAYTGGGTATYSHEGQNPVGGESPDDAPGAFDVVLRVNGGEVLRFSANEESVEVNPPTGTFIIGEKIKWSGTYPADVLGRSADLPAEGFGIITSIGDEGGRLILRYRKGSPANSLTDEDVIANGMPFHGTTPTTITALAGGSGATTTTVERGILQLLQDVTLDNGRVVPGIISRINALPDWTAVDLGKISFSIKPSYTLENPITIESSPTEIFIASPDHGDFVQWFRSNNAEFPNNNWVTRNILIENAEQSFTWNEQNSPGIQRAEQVFWFDGSFNYGGWEGVYAVSCELPTYQGTSFLPRSALTHRMENCGFFFVNIHDHRFDPFFDLGTIAELTPVNFFFSGCIMDYPVQTFIAENENRIYAVENHYMMDPNPLTDTQLIFGTELTRQNDNSLVFQNADSNNFTPVDGSPLLSRVESNTNIFNLDGDQIVSGYPIGPRSPSSFESTIVSKAFNVMSRRRFIG